MDNCLAQSSLQLFADTEETVKMAIVVAHAGAETLSECLLSWNWPLATFVVDGRQSGVLPAYQIGFNVSQGYDILAYLHDDLRIDGLTWAEDVLMQFEDPQVGLVGFGGALQHGSSDIYQASYDYRQLGRSYFLSNMDDAEVHGHRFTGSCDVAVLDGFALIVRRELLEKAGGWPVDKLGYVGYDYWLCCMAHRLGYRIRLVGVACKHYGGQTFVKLGLGVGEKHWQQFTEAHEYIHKEFKDVLPWQVEGP